MSWIVWIIVGILLGFVVGILVGRKNKVKIENVIARVKEEYEDYKEKRG